MRHEEAICENCSETFFRSRKDKRYCSNTCRQEAFQKRQQTGESDYDYNVDDNEYEDVKQQELVEKIFELQKENSVLNYIISDLKSKHKEKINQLESKIQEYEKLELNKRTVYTFPDTLESKFFNVAEELILLESMEDGVEEDTLKAFLAKIKNLRKKLLAWLRKSNLSVEDFNELYFIDAMIEEVKEGLKVLSGGGFFSSSYYNLQFEAFFIDELKKQIFYT